MDLKGELIIVLVCFKHTWNHTLYITIIINHIIETLDIKDKNPIEVDQKGGFEIRPKQHIMVKEGSDGKFIMNPI